MNNLYLMIVLVFLSLSTLSFGQGLLNESWFITKDGPASNADFAWGVDIDDNENVYWVTSQKVNPTNEKDIYSYKINPAGNEMWSNPHGYEAENEQQAYNAEFKNGILYVAGRTWTDDGLIYSNTLVYAIDTTLQDTLWSWTYDGGSGYEEVDGLVVEPDGIYVSGWTQDSVNNYDMFVARLTLNGNLDWFTQFGTNNFDTADGHCVVDDSTVYVSGMYNSWGFAFFGKAALYAFDRNTGNYKWHQEWGGNGQEDGLGLNTDGTYLYQCGVTSSFGDSLVFINKYDKNGGLIWTAHTNMVIKTRSLDIDANGDLYLAATTDSYGAGGEDLMIMRYNSTTGNLIDYRLWGGAENESVQDIKINGNYMYLVGRTISYSGNIFDDAFLIKAPLFDFNAITEDDHTNIKVYPNPVTDILNVENVNNLSTITVTDILENTIYTSKGSYLQNLQINTGNWPAGVYFLKIDNSVIHKIIRR